MPGVAIICLLSLPAAGPLDLEPGDLRPGLVAEYRSLRASKATLPRIDPKPAFTLGRSSPHPRIPPGPFEVNWSGVLAVRDPGPISFSALVGGELTMTVDGVTVLTGRGATETNRVAAKEPFNREPGEYRVTIKYRSLADVPARLQLWWEGPSFAREVIPAWRFGHVRADQTPALQQEELASQGRAAVGRFGCARCHAGTLPAVTDPPPGPSLADAARRLNRTWAMNWLADPAKVRPESHMPALFTADRAGYVERWIVADQITGGRDEKPAPATRGDHRAGRLEFLGLGCAACHFVPDIDRAEQSDLNRMPLVGLGDRFAASELATFLGNPHGRYPDGRMPRLPVTATQAGDIAAYLLLWSKSSDLSPAEPPTAKEIQDTARRLGARDAASAAAVLLRDKGCQSCHPGLGETRPRDIPIKDAGRGCVAGTTGPRYSPSADIRAALAAYLAVANKEAYPSPFAARQQRLAQLGCVQCHQRDTSRPPPVEEAGSKLGGAFLQELPFLRTPRLSNPHQKLRREYLIQTVREGNPNLHWSRYSYRMPAFSSEAESLVQALAEADGELISESDAAEPTATDPTLGTLHGSRLAGFQGYGCVSCHVWNNRQLASADPVATGPDLTRTAGRLRRDWFDRYLEAPLRYHPGTPMPSVFPHGKPATLTAVLESDAAKQKDALWAYFALGKDAPNPKPPPPVPIDAPKAGEAPIVAQIPIRFADGKVVESLCILNSHGDLLVYDLATGSPHSLFTGGRILRTVQGRIRQFIADGTYHDLTANSPVQLTGGEKPELPRERNLIGYRLTGETVRLNWEIRFTSQRLQLEQDLSFESDGEKRRLKNRLMISDLPNGRDIEFRLGKPKDWKHSLDVTKGREIGSTVSENQLLTKISPGDGPIDVEVSFELPPASTPAKWDLPPGQLDQSIEGSLVRPGYKAIGYLRPKTVFGEDRVMPGAVAVRPHDGQVFVASMKTGELFALHDPDGTGKNARLERYGTGLYQDALSMLAEDDGLYILHRRNLTKVVESQGQPTQFIRIAALPHGVADTYDMAYGLVRTKSGQFIFGYAPYADAKMPGAGGALRLTPGKPPEEIAFGMRNPLGWCGGPDGELFFTDNQGDWVASNKLCHIVEGRYYGWPNRAQKEHISKPAGKTTVWVPYGWARSINGVAYDSTGGKFGPFAGQFFMAELMYGGAIIRANVEKVNGVYQGACFPFWGKGLLGPVCLAFDPKGPLYVGGITEPGWMAQPDRGALFRIDYTGKVPFEMQSIHVRPRGFRVIFTAPVDKTTAADPASYRLEHYRYEYTGAYGSPELDRTAVKVERVEVAADGRSAELKTAPLVKDRVYLLTSTVRAATGERLVYPTGAYTLNEVPPDKE
jgi:mono/diheme cytochrome c family protein